MIHAHHISYLEAVNLRITTKPKLYAPCVTKTSMVDTQQQKSVKKILPKHVPESMQADEKNMFDFFVDGCGMCLPEQIK